MLRLGQKENLIKAIACLSFTFLLQNEATTACSGDAVCEGQERGKEACWPWSRRPRVCAQSHRKPAVRLRSGTRPLPASTPPSQRCQTRPSGKVLSTGQRSGEHWAAVAAVEAPASPPPRPPGRYLGGVVGDALEDPVHGGRVQGQVGRKLHSLDHQLVLDCIPVDLQETK